MIVLMSLAIMISSIFRVLRIRRARRISHICRKVVVCVLLDIRVTSAACSLSIISRQVLLARLVRLVRVAPTLLLEESEVT